MSESKYTVFTADADFLCNGTRSPEFGGLPLETLIERGLASFGVPYVAWAAEVPHSYGGAKSRDGLYAESIAAGRLIELVDGKYVARGMTPTLDKLEAEKRMELHSPELDAAVEFLVEIGKKHGLLLKRAPTIDPNAGMIARDGPAKPVTILFTCVDCTGCQKCAPRTAKPFTGTLHANPFHARSAFRAPDFCKGSADHLNASTRKLAGLDG